MRNELARELRRAGEGEAADQVSGLRKPSTAAWAINRLARDDGAAVRRVLDAGKRLRAAQEHALESRSSTKLRDAAAKERDAVDDAVERAARILGARATEPILDRVRSSLHAAASDDEVRDAIKDGRLTRDHEPVGLGTFGTSAAPRQALSHTPDRKASKRSSKQAQAARKRLREARAGDQKASRRVERARRELESRRQAASRAQEQLGAAQAELDEAEADSERAAGEVARAERGDSRQ